MKMWHEMPTTDDEVLASFDESVSDKALKGLYEIRRELGMSVADAIGCVLEFACGIPKEKRIIKDVFPMSKIGTTEEQHQPNPEIARKYLRGFEGIGGAIG